MKGKEIIEGKELQKLWWSKNRRIDRKERNEKMKTLQERKMLEIEEKNMKGKKVIEGKEL